MTRENTLEKPVVVPLPESDEGKKEQVAGMFDRISGKYDFLNHFLSMGIDKGWRRKAINAIQLVQPKMILDVATGTGDLAIEALRLMPDQVIGVDISKGMLDIGREKLRLRGLDQKILLKEGDSEHLNFESGSFDAVICAYGVRNFEHIEKGLAEMSRVLRSGGMVSILEFSRPKRFPVKQVYSFYFKHILPGIGKLVSKDATAYTYLPESVAVFPEGAAFCELLEKNGFTTIKARPLTLGITTLYVATKK